MDRKLKKISNLHSYILYNRHPSERVAVEAVVEPWNKGPHSEHRDSAVV